jgi:hypothetical protein
MEANGFNRSAAGGQNGGDVSVMSDEGIAPYD